MEHDQFIKIMAMTGQLDPAQAAEALAGNQQQSDRNRSDIEADKRARLAENRDILAQRRRNQQDQHAQEQVRIGEAFNDALARTASKTDDATAAIDVEIAALTQELTNLRVKATDIHTYGSTATNRLKKPPTEEVEALKSKTSAVGSFSASAAFGFGPGGIGARIAKATEETAKNTKKINLSQVQFT